MTNSVQKHSKNLPCVILAGGKSSRMQGENKALINLGGKRLIDHVIIKLRRSTHNIALNVNSETKIFEKYELPLLKDTLEGYLGPLAGVLSAMRWAEELGSSKVITVAADTPFFPSHLYDIFSSFSAEFDIVMASSRQPDGKNRRHPIFCTWSVNLRNELEVAIKRGVRKIVDWTDQYNVKNVIFEQKLDFDPFFNVNTRDDLLVAKGILDKGY